MSKTSENNAIGKRSAREIISADRIIPLAILVILCAFIGIINPQFFTWTKWQNTFMQVSNVGIIALGAMLVITSGGLDFTAGDGVTLAGTFTAMVFVLFNTNLGFTYGMSWVTNLMAIIAGVGMGAIMGGISGLIITKLKIQPFITTLAMMTIIKGFMLFLSEGRIIHLDVAGATFKKIGQGIIPFPGALGTSAQGNVQGIPVAFVIFVAIAIIIAILLKRTRFGQAIFAMGGNEEAARLAGVRVDWYRFWVFTLAGALTGAGAIITLARAASIGISLGGTTLLMDVVAAAVIGGTSVSGGKCNVFGVIVGAFIIVTITSALNYLNIDTNWRTAVKGFIILAALCIDIVAKRISQRAQEREAIRLAEERHQKLGIGIEKN